MPRCSCPSCQRILEFPSEAANQIGTCPNCHARLRLPGKGTVLAVPYVEGQKTKLATQSETALEVTTADVVGCPNCGSLRQHERQVFSDLFHWLLIPSILIFWPAAFAVCYFCRDKWMVCSECGTRLRKLSDTAIF